MADRHATASTPSTERPGDLAAARTAKRIARRIDAYYGGTVRDLAPVEFAYLEILAVLAAAMSSRRESKLDHARRMLAHLEKQRAP
jgi:hypothetical protein